MGRHGRLEDCPDPTDQAPSDIMDERRQELERKLEAQLKATAETAAELQKLDQSGVPHMTRIENAAHEVSERLSRAIQRLRNLELALELSEADCPDCGKRHTLEYRAREIQSIDGPFELMEPTAQCKDCRRSFFPSARAAGH